MNTNYNIILLLSVFFGYGEINCSQTPVNFFGSPNQKNNVLSIDITQNQMLAAIQAKDTIANTNYDDIEHHANELIKQNYKTDTMKYDILLLMSSDIFNKKSKKNDSLLSTQESNPFMKVIIETASVTNLPTIFEILKKTHGIVPENENRREILNGLNATLRAINGAVADIQFDKKSTFMHNDIEVKLHHMQKRIEQRIKEINPSSWLKVTLGIGSLAAIATIAGAYYSGITFQDSQNYIKDLIKNYQQQPNMVVSL